MPGQVTADRRSLALHRAVAQRLRTDPTLLDRARARHAQRRDALHRRWADGWDRLLALDAADLAVALSQDTPEMADLRQTSPFAGALPPRDRWQILREAST